MILPLLQLDRSYYSSYAQLVSDFNMIIDAAKMYHRPGGGVAPNPAVIRAAELMVQEGLKALETPDIVSSIAYWEMRVQVSGLVKAMKEAMAEKMGLKRVAGCCCG